MNRAPLKIGGAVILLLALLLGYGGWQLLENERVSVCYACGRPLGGHSQTVGLVEGKRELFCCPACALALQRQTGSEVEVIELTAHDSQQPLSPADAFLVVDSRVNHCLRTEPHLDEHGRVGRLDFDRCSPSVLSFSTESAARAFIAANGGKLMDFEDMEAALR
jgi:hypothetical protein